MFNKPSISTYYTALSQGLEKHIQQSASEFISETSTDNLVEHFLQSVDSIQPIKFDPDRKETMKHRKEMRIVSARQREDGYQSEGDKEFEYEIIDIVIPILPNKNISLIEELEPSTHSLSWSPRDIKWSNDHISFSLEIKGYGFKYDDDKTANEIASQKKHIQDWIGWVNKDIEQGTKMLRENLTPFVNDRKKKLEEDKKRMNNLSEKMGIALEEKNDE